jgi:(heptosyl)LPS beta-1,4-glucosyltransferase
MKKISICIICKNEESKIADCLASVSWADEIVIVDSGSTDNTLEIAKEFTDKIFVEESWSGFGLQRRRAEDFATNDWVFAIDCDEIVTEELKNEILSQVNIASNNDVFYINRLTNFCGQFIYHSGWYPDRIARLYNKVSYRYNEALVHEALDCKGCNKIRLKGDLLHYQYDDIYQYINKRNGYANLGAEYKHKQGKQSGILKATSSAIFAFIRHYFLRLGFMDGRLGFVIAIIQMQYTFNKYLFTYFLQRKNKK